MNMGNNKFSGKFGGSASVQNPYLARDKEKKEREAQKKKQLDKLYASIPDLCAEISNAAYNLKAVDGDDETNIMKACRRIEDYISDIRRKYREIEKLKYSDDD